MDEKNKTIGCIIPVYRDFAGAAECVHASRVFAKKIILLFSVDADFISVPECECVRLSENDSMQSAIYDHAKAMNEDNIIIFDNETYDVRLPQSILDDLRENDDCILLGKEEKNSKRGIYFDFLFYIETGLKRRNLCFGFQVYPQRLFSKVKIRWKNHFQMETIAKGTWGGLRLKELPVETPHHPSISFKNRIALLLIHCYLLCFRILPIRATHLVEKQPKPYSFLRHPLRVLKEQLYENASPSGLAASAFVGSFLAVLPLVFVHMIVILYVTHRLKLNKVIALGIQNLFMPPVTPFLCIQLGYFLMHGQFLTTLTFQTVVKEMHLRIFEWLLGSLIIAPVFAFFAAIAVWFIATCIKQFSKRKQTG